MSNENYNLEMERVLNRKGPLPKLLLHCCCAPCSSAVLERLDGRIDMALLYDNPNIAPESEYNNRLEELKRLTREMPLKSRPEVLSSEYAPQTFYDAVCGLEDEPEGGRRCEVCFRLRLENTARRALRENCGMIATTLTISPLKNADVLNKVGREVAAEHGLEWLPSDFKKKDGYRRSVELSAEYCLYRQDYCGCVFSRKPKNE